MEQEFSNQPKNMEFKPRVHGNGFIQLDLTPTKRLHIWGHPAIPCQTPPTPIHNHQFSFTSRVIVGVMKNRRYRALASTPQKGTHVLHTAVVREKEDTILETTGVFLELIPAIEIELYRPGDSYEMKAGEIHESIPVGFVVTIIDKTGLTLSQGGPTPCVYVPRDVTPDNTFRRYSHTEDTLWEIVAEVLQKGRIPRGL